METDDVFELCREQEKLLTLEDYILQGFTDLDLGIGQEDAPSDPLVKTGYYLTRDIPHFIDTIVKDKDYRVGRRQSFCLATKAGIKVFDKRYRNQCLNMGIYRKALYLIDEIVSLYTVNCDSILSCVDYSDVLKTKSSKSKVKMNAWMLYRTQSAMLQIADDIFSNKSNIFELLFYSGLSISDKILSRKKIEFVENRLKEYDEAMKEREIEIGEITIKLFNEHLPRLNHESIVDNVDYIKQINEILGMIK